MSEDSDDRDEDDYEYSHNLAIQMKRQLTVHGKVYLSLPKVEEGSMKKMRFTIVTLCPECGAANHVQHVDLDTKERKKECEVCHNSQVFAAKTDIFSVYAPIGTRHGSTIMFQDEGSFGPQGIRGDIVVTFLDEPHEHFLRVFDDIVVCFQIDLDESANGGVVRLLSLVIPSPHVIVLKTEEGEAICNNEVRYVNGLGLPNSNSKEKRGKLIIVFIVKDQRSMFPVKLKDIVMFSSKAVENGHIEEKVSDGIFPSSVIDEMKEADSTAPKTNGLKRSRPPRWQHPRKRRKGTFIEAKASTSSESLSAEPNSPAKSSKDRVSSPVNPPSVDIDIDEEAQVRCSRILDNPIGRLTANDIDKNDPLDPKQLSFLDRIIYFRTIPLPYKTPVADPIPLSDLTVLWERLYDPVWWQRVRWAQALPKDVDSLKAELFPRRGPSKRSSKICFADTPLFDVREGKLDDTAEALKTMCTMHSSSNPEYLRITPQKLTSDERYLLLYRIKRYLQGSDQ